MKLIYHVFTEANGEMDWFFDNKYNVITYWWSNDATWRGEYMNNLLNYCGATVKDVSVDLSDKKSRLANALRQGLKEVGASDEDLE